MVTIKEIKTCETAFRFWTNNYTSHQIDNLFGELVIEKKVESKNKIWYIIKAGESNTMIECLYRKFIPLQKRIEIL